MTSVFGRSGDHSPNGSVTAMPGAVGTSRSSLDARAGLDDRPGEQIVVVHLLAEPEDGRAVPREPLLLVEAQGLRGLLPRLEPEHVAPCRARRRLAGAHQ